MEEDIEETKKEIIKEKVVEEQMIKESEDIPEDEISDEELAEKITELIGSTPQPIDKSNVHTFLHNVATAKDTTKTGYITSEELGQYPITLRACKELALISDKIIDNEYFKEFFEAEGEIITSTSLSREGFLDRLAITQKVQTENLTEKPKKENSGWFKKKNANTGAAPAPVMEH